MTQGKNDTKNAAACIYNNVDNKNVIDIEIEHVAQPSLQNPPRGCRKAPHFAGKRL